MLLNVLQVNSIFFCQIEFNYTPLSFVVCCCKLNNTQDCGKHLFRQVSTPTGHYQLPIFGCTKCTSEDTLAHNLGALYFDNVMSYNLLTRHCSFSQFKFFLFQDEDDSQDSKNGLDTSTESPIKHIVSKFDSRLRSENSNHLSTVGI